MSQARNNIFDRLKAVGLEASNSFEEPRAQNESSALSSKSSSVSTKISAKINFVKKLEANHAKVIECSSATLQQTLAEIVKSKKIKSCLISERTGWLEAEDIGEARCVYFPKKIEDFKNELFNEIDAAVTTSRGAITETGTIILWPDTIEPRSMSLVPPLHIVIVEEKSMHSTFSEVIENEVWQSGMPSNVVLVSGPSKTADIQQTLAYGAHGPRELIVVLVAAK